MTVLWDHSGLPCRAKGMIVISDEIFAGLWRLGSASAWERLHIVPDVACYAKLLTGKSETQHCHVM